MSNAEEHSVHRSGGRVLAWVAVVFAAALLVVVAWLLMKPAPAAASGDLPAVASTEKTLLEVAVSTGAPSDTSHPPLADGTAPLQCLSCHNQTLTYHDKLGPGNQACYACHVSTDWLMDSLQLASGQVISINDSSQLCGQCHQERYAAWNEGTHGIPGTVAAVPCVTCHNPHQPQVEFQSITKPPMPPVHTPPPLPKDVVIILGISVGCLLAGAVYMARRRTGE